MPAPNYRTLKPVKIIETQKHLRDRIVKRFPGSGLSGVAAELLTVAEEAAVRAEKIRHPNISLRISVGVLLLSAVVSAIAMARSLQMRADLHEVMNLVQFVEAGLGTIVFLSVAVLFMLTLELRLKRSRALAAIHELRAIAHVVDMHQVGKQPDGLVHRGGPAVSQSPQQTTKTLFELNRYLNYCNELLAIISKIAAIYVQDFPDANSVAAVDQIETLCSGLSQKISQKIIVLEQILDEPDVHGNEEMTGMAAAAAIPVG